MAQRRPAGLDGGADGIGSFRAGGFLGPAHARAHGPRAPGPDGADPSRGRVYDPTLGRFLSPDPLVGNRGSAQAWNGYSYVSNSPMSFVDPSGLSQAPGAGAATWSA